MASRYIKRRGAAYVIVSRKTGKVLSRHKTKRKAEASFRALEYFKHGGKRARKPSRKRSRR